MTGSGRAFEAGFTLVEMLVALVAGGLLMAAVTWMIATLGTAWRLSLEARDDLEVSEVTKRVLTQLIEQAYPAEGQEVVLRGETQAMAFTAIAPLALGAGETVRVEVRRTPDAVLAVILTPQRGVRGGPVEVRLMEAVTDVVFRYGRMTADGLKWSNGWAGKAMPRVVEITILRQGGSLPLRLVVEPRLTVDPRCGFDPVSLGCRL